jgi:pyridinium-3,5-biscarboxylic acid mononucleotide synthase
MDPEALRQLLERLRRGEIPIGEAMERLRELPFETLDEARVDHHRALRRGFPEVVYGAGKTPAQAVAIARAIAARGQTVLVTRTNAELQAALTAAFPAAAADPVARTVVLRAGEVPPLPGRVLVVSAGTSDLPVAAEAQVTAETLGCTVERLVDVGVAGLHRILSASRLLREAEVIIAVAGMEGALPSVITGLTDRPVIAVPTSVGYGASFDGLAALLGMLSSCSPGLVVVNIDNGFGAGYAAASILRTGVGIGAKAVAAGPGGRAR